MSGEGPKALILRPAYGLQQPGFGAEKVLSRIVSDALTIARGRDVADVSVRIRIGKYEFREQDYQQILIWADATEKSPEWLVSLLAEVKSAFLDGSSFVVENGSIKHVAFPNSILKAKKLKIAHGQEIIKISCCENHLTELDLSNVPALTNLNCFGNQLTELDFSNVPELTQLYCTKNHLTELDLSNVPALTKLDCSFNRLTEFDPSNIPALTELCCSYNRLTKLDLSNVPALKDLNCQYNRLTELDLSNVPALTSLACKKNEISELDVRRNTNLEDLSCDPWVKIIKHEWQ